MARLDLIHSSTTLAGLFIPETRCTGIPYFRRDSAGRAAGV
jgi:hypothetical protein